MGTTGSARTLAAELPTSSMGANRAITALLPLLSRLPVEAQFTGSFSSGSRRLRSTWILTCPCTAAAASNQKTACAKAGLDVFDLPLARFTYIEVGRAS
ncbi:hypothetical protein GUJ93_ZPchr0001g32414 [Zizania palustris]|uniref:Uncharacterized protein n=1 Tax=Zizania palustris TaxID=103762 RepID=A0A8J5RPT3_ZIZPA|nr:hypothetical protein GUJ93_ZPchr0001g32414 [Zizania palustris]